MNRFIIRFTPPAPLWPLRKALQTIVDDRAAGTMDISVRVIGSRSADACRVKEADIKSVITALVDSGLARHIWVTPEGVA